MITFNLCHAWRSRVRCLGVSLAVLTTLSFSSSPQAIAAETLVVTYGGFSTSVDLAELEHLAETGEASNSMEFYLGLANLEPEMLQRLLSQNFNVSVKFVEDVISTPSGAEVLERITNVLHTQSGAGSLPALRSTLIQSTVDDSQLSLLELLQNYPTDRVYLNSRNLIQLIQDFEAIFPDTSFSETL